MKALKSHCKNGHEYTPENTYNMGSGARVCKTCSRKWNGIVSAAQNRTLEERFWEKVDKTEGCWNWQAGKTVFGYGCIWTGKKLGMAHRVSYELANGPIQGGLFVCHRCDNPACVNPEHLFLGSHRENMDDCIKKGRLSTPPISQNAGKTHCSKGHEFTPENTYTQITKGKAHRVCITCRKRWAKAKRDKASLKNAELRAQSI